MGVTDIRTYPKDIWLRIFEILLSAYICPRARNYMCFQLQLVSRQFCEVSKLIFLRRLLLNFRLSKNRCHQCQKTHRPIPYEALVRLSKPDTLVVLVREIDIDLSGLPSSDRMYKWVSEFMLRATRLQSIELTGGILPTPFLVQQDISTTPSFGNSIRTLTLNVDNKWWHSANRDQTCRILGNLHNLSKLELSFWLPEYPTYLTSLRLTANVHVNNMCTYDTWAPIVRLTRLENLELEPPPWVQSDYDFSETSPLPPILCTGLKSLFINDYHGVVDTAQMTALILKACTCLERFTYWNAPLLAQFILPGSLIFLRTGGTSLNEFENDEPDIISAEKMWEFVQQLKKLEHLKFDLTKVRMTNWKGKMTRNGRALFSELTENTSLCTITIEDFGSHRSMQDKGWKHLFNKFPGGLSLENGGEGQVDLLINCVAIRNQHRCNIGGS